MKNINLPDYLEQERRNRPQTNFNRQNWKPRNDCRVEVGGVGVEGMMRLEKVGVHVLEEK